MKHTYRNFLALQICLFVIFPFFSFNPLMEQYVELGLGISLLSIGLLLTIHKPRYKSLLLPFITVFILWVAEIHFPTIQYLKETRLILFILFFVKTMWVLGHRVFIDPRTNTSDRLMGTVSVYLLIMAFFGYLYQLAALFSPDALICNSSLCQEGEVLSPRDGNGLYFSAVVLTTVGFGDLIPGTRIVAMMASIEALLGQMYIAIAIARIVGMKSLEVRTETHDKTD